MQVAKLDGLLAIDVALNLTPFAWLKAVPIAPKADHVRELLKWALPPHLHHPQPGRAAVPAMERDQVLAAVRKTAPHWRLLEVAPF